MIYSWKGTREFLSINPHLFGKPSPNDYTQSLIISLLYKSDIGLPWKNLSFPNKSKYSETFKMKTNFDYYKFCGRKYEFLSDSLQ